MGNTTKRTILALLGAFTLLFGLLPLMSPVAAATFTATNHRDDIDADLGDNQCNAPGLFQGCTLRAAIMQLNALGPGPHTLTLEPGIYDLTIENANASDEELARTGDLDIRSNITIGVQGTGSATIIVNSNLKNFRVFDIHPQGSLTLNRVSVDGGDGDAPIGGGGVTSGGGIFNDGTLTMIGGAIIGSKNGGFVNSGTATLTGTDVRDNQLGGIRNEGTLTLNGNARVRNNDSIGLRNDPNGTLDVNETTISGNDVGIVNEGTLQMDESTVDGNALNGTSNGGIHNKGQATITRTTVSNNARGGIKTEGATASLLLTNSTISGNARGGLIFSTSATGNLNMVTITHNTGTASVAGGLSVESASVVRMANTILAANLNTTGTTIDCEGAITTQDYNLVGNLGGCFTPAAHDLVGSASSPLDPRLLPLANNGGKTKTHATDGGSQAIEHGNPSLLGVGLFVCNRGQAQNGVNRILDSNGDNVRVCDIGAFEKP